MCILNRRLQVLVDDERFELLTRESKRTGAPVGELARRAIDHEFSAEDSASSRDTRAQRTRRGLRICRLSVIRSDNF
jgi:hypothetical protein